MFSAGPLPGESSPWDVSAGGFPGGEIVSGSEKSCHCRSSRVPWRKKCLWHKGAA